MAELVRCAWAESDPLLRTYHDREWGVPEFDSRKLWETLMLEGFQAGLSWLVILRKRAAFRDAFAQFDPEAVARFDATDIERLMQNAGIVRSRAKLEATVAGAKIYLGMRHAGLDFSKYVWDLAGGKPIQHSGTVPAQTPLSEAMSKDLKNAGFSLWGR